MKIDEINTLLAACEQEIVKKEFACNADTRYLEGRLGALKQIAVRQDESDVGVHNDEINES